MVEKGTSPKKVGKRAILACLIVALYIGVIVGGIMLKALPVTQAACVASISAVPDSGAVTYRGMIVDEVWYTPTESIISNDGWIENTEENIFTASGDGQLVVNIPEGKKQEICFNVGLDQGRAFVTIEDITKEYVMTIDTDWDRGWYFEVFAHSVVMDTDAIYVGLGVFVVMFVVLVSLCYRFRIQRFTDLLGSGD